MLATAIHKKPACSRPKAELGGGGGGEGSD